MIRDAYERMISSTSGAVLIQRLEASFQKTSSKATPSSEQANIEGAASCPPKMKAP